MHYNGIYPHKLINNEGSCRSKCIFSAGSLCTETRLELVEVLTERWDALLETLALSDRGDDLEDLVALLVWVSRNRSPVIEGALWESLSSGVGTQIGGETERLHDWKVGKEGHLWGSRSLLLAVDVSTTAG